MEEKINIGTYSILDVETFEAAEFSSAWFIGNADELEKRKYGQNTFSDKFTEVYNWVGDNRSRIRNLTLEQQEEIMIAEGILTKDDI
ncbi:MAG: hypothetical protein NC452_13720 [Eubacterium sp.]|nr:hypothetical protein [Eubacterium sp.]